MYNDEEVNDQVSSLKSVDSRMVLVKKNEINGKYYLFIGRNEDDPDWEISEKELKALHEATKKAIYDDGISL